MDVSNLDLLPGVGLGEQHQSPRNAWVSCDDCHKWRRIPARLADLIDETKCTWYTVFFRITHHQFYVIFKYKLKRHNMI